MYEKINVMQNSFLENLNPEQLEAVEATEGALLVLAGAGTGKTKVLTSRIANILAKGIFPGQILAVTFTNKAAKEMGNRVADITQNRSQGIWLGTFHSIGSKILRRHAGLVGLESNFTIIDTSDQLRLIKQIYAERGLDEKRWDPKIMLGIISKWKDRAVTSDKMSAADNVDFAGGQANLLYVDYQNRLKSLNAADFGDLLLHNLTIFQNNPDILSEYQRRFQYILVDEYQDTNISQYLWLRLLAQRHKNICCVGDDDQSIYGWRGAEVGNILKFEKDFKGAKTIRLEQNYRSTSHILSAASNLISKNTTRLGKTLWTESSGGEPIKLMAMWDDQEEARTVANEIESLQQVKSHKLSEIAILVRAGFQTRSFEEAFINRSIPYRVIGGLRFYERLEIRDIIAYMRVVTQNNDDLAFERIINTPKRGLGPSTIQNIRQYAQEQGVSMCEAVRLMLEEDLFKPKVGAALAGLIGNFDHWRSLIDEMSTPEAVELIVKESGYFAMWKEDKSLEAQGRVENIKELIRALDDFETIADFLEHVSLVADIDGMDQENMVSIMTIHSAKGLEFETVFLPGWEEGLFPHQKSLDEKGSSGLEEERRLAYVAITRAKERAYILFAANRRIYGQYQSSTPSRFIDDLPVENVEKIDSNNGFNFGKNIEKPSYSGAQKSQNNSRSARSTAKSPEGFTVGNRVFHQKFGYGKITAISCDQLDIAFEKAGNKKVIDRYVEGA